jgi:hypothetical protein
MMISRWLRLCCALPLLAAPLAHAQYSWMDAKGTRVFSDRPPPPGTPPAKILKAPKPVSPYAQDVPEAAPAAAPQDATDAKAPKPAGPPTLAERDADFKKRAEKREEDARKAAEQARQRAETAERCQALREEQAGLASGRRTVRTTGSGEQQYLSDEERARQLGKVQRALAECR